VPETEGSTHARARERDVAPDLAPAPATERGARQAGYIDAVLGLQATAGNQAVVQLLRASGQRAGAAGAADAVAASHTPSYPGAAGSVGASGGFAGALFAGAWTFGRHPEFPAAMGQTWYSHNDLSWPTFSLKVEQQILPPWDYEAKPDKSSASKPSWKVLSTPESADGYVMNEHPNYPGKEHRIRVSSTSAKKIKDAEQQHVSDLDRGWGISAGAIDNAINIANAEDAIVGDSAAAAKSAAIDKIVGRVGDLGPKIKPALEKGGKLESVVGPMMDNAFTISRTKRDDTGNHKIPVSQDPVEKTDTAVIFEAQGETALDATSSRDIISIATIGGS
jgi:hypothetical protein